MTGLAYPNEKEALKALWQACFHEEQRFLDWFFDERFLPSYCVRKVVDNEIVCAMHGLPVYARIRDTLQPAVLIAGVATREDVRGQGHMREVYTKFLRVMRGYGVSAVLQHPVNAAIYASLQQYPCADARFLTLPPGTPRPAQTGFTARACDPLSERAALYRCYDAYFQPYSCSIARTYADFVFKCEDYLADEGRCVAVFDDARALGYGIYFEEDGALLCDEYAALTDAAYAALLHALADRAAAAGKPLKLRMPPDVRIPGMDACESVVTPHSLIGAVNVPRLLAAAGLRARVAIAVTDNVIAENNGVFLQDGSRTEEAPHIRMDAGRLAQWAVGYRSAKELADAGEADVLKSESIALLDAVGKRRCYLVEEY